MSGDLVKRLRENCGCNIETSPCGCEDECRAAQQAAARIEELEAKLAKVMKTLDKVQPGKYGLSAIRARFTLKELKGTSQ